MTCEQRLMELGVDPAIISLHEDRCDALYERFFKASEAIAQELGVGFNALTMMTLLLREIAERDDIIDRMETRIVNLTGERDYLQQISDELAEECGYSTEYDGVPEYWRADDGCSD